MGRLHIIPLRELATFFGHGIGRCFRVGKLYNCISFIFALLGNVPKKEFSFFKGRVIMRKVFLSLDGNKLEILAKKG